MPPRSVSSACSRSSLIWAGLDLLAMGLLSGNRGRAPTIACAAANRREPSRENCVGTGLAANAEGLSSRVCMGVPARRRGWAQNPGMDKSAASPSPQNQPPEFTPRDLWQDDAALREAVTREGGVAYAD